ncbi:putative bifunctional diguanylate cyclase/phosphodiesterase [Bacillus sp. B1-b2]|uniref:putative bifunctional diguanylate cyclase/phosphodiesterase n=1 Tax=Bacillus sp. B1-b2 TaxID=2653201 RepID=UPI00186AA6C9|nr:EAL domain-containing protein [Bacillus sp. B1-b2]
MHTLVNWIENNKRKSELHLSLKEDFLDKIENGLFIVRSDWKIVYLNHQIELIMEKKREELIGINMWDVFPQELHSENYNHFRVALEKKVSVVFEVYFDHLDEWLEVRIMPIEDELIGYTLNITERKKYQKSIEDIAFYDFITGLPNRRSFEMILDQTIKKSKSEQDTFALLYIDMDRFKYINETLGHRLGDELVKQMADRLVQLIGDKGVVSRVGGDEFAIILEKQLVLESQVQPLVHHIIKNLEEVPFYLSEFELFVTVSLGISMYPEHGKDVQTILKNADIALYRSKEKGRNSYMLFNPMMDINSFRKLSLERDLRVAIQEDMLTLHFQPRVCTKTRKILSAEALIRWNHPEWGMLSPAEFLPIAEETGLILPLTYWVMRDVCKQICVWKVGNAEVVPISINVSAHLFTSKNFLSNIKSILRESGIDGKLIEIEITETSILDNHLLVESTIKELKKQGIRVSIDDFGTGYSSFAYLTQFNADGLKIDRQFIRRIMENPKDATVVSSIIRLAQGLEMKVVAEGVETLDQLTFLSQQNCDEIQGYIFSKPLPANEFYKLLTKSVLEYPEKNTVNSIEKDNGNRLTLSSPINAQMTIIKIKDKDILIGNSEIFIEEIGEYDMVIESPLSLSINESVIYQFNVDYIGKNRTISGYILEKEEAENNRFRYLVKDRSGDLKTVWDELKLETK